MTHRPRSPSFAVIAAALALLALVGSPAPAAAASSVQVEARALAGGRYEVNGWVAVAVTLVNTGEPTDGYLLSTTDAGTVRQYVELPAGARKAVTLYVQPDAFQRSVDLRYEEPNGTATASVEVRVFESSQRQIAIVGDGAGTIRPQLAGGVDPGSAEPIGFMPADLPERVEPLRGIDAIVWAGDSSELSADQARSLERWVADGGELVVSAGADWQSRTAGFAALLPMTALTATDGVPLGALASWTASTVAPGETATVASGELRDGARAVVTAEDGTVLASMLDVGAGRVILLGPDVATGDFRGWEGAPRLWNRLIPSADAFADFIGQPIDVDVATAMNQALGNIPALAVPPAELLLAVIVGYILLIGPISYVVLRRLDRRELAWITAPVLVIVFSASSYGIGVAAKGGEVVLNEIALVRSSEHGTTATVETYAGVFSPERDTYDLRVDADALVGRLPRNDGFGTRTSTSVSDQGRPSTLRGLSIGVFGFESISAAGMVDHVTPLAVSWSMDDGDLVGLVTNTGDEPLEDVAYISGSGGEMVGDLGPGEEAEFRIPRVNLNGSSAADQVYGFGGFDATSEEQRTVMMRRSVIESLVGYGGMTVGMELDAALGRGPYLIAWHPGDGPMPVSIEGASARRLATTVEVLSVRPVVAFGEMTVSPARVSVAVTAVEGDAEFAGPGSAIVANGSATYALTFPLEMAGMTVSELEILAGPDPGAILSNQGNGLVGFWPSGTTIELLDATTGTWTPLGDLGEASVFEVADPAAAIGQTGTITVRVSSGAPMDEFSGTSVFVSARATGTVAP
jgi:hypothetical protein